MREKILIWISWHMPKSIVYWCSIRLMTFNFGGNPANRTCFDALKGWDA